MKIPHLVWNRRHNVAAISVSYGRRVWQTREVADLILGFNAAGRLSRIVILDPKRLFPADATVADALAIVTETLVRHGGIRQPDLDVLRSALDRAGEPMAPETERVRSRGPFPLAPGAGPRSSIRRSRSTGTAP